MVFSVDYSDIQCHNTHAAFDNVTATAAQRLLEKATLYACYLIGITWIGHVSTHMQGRVQFDSNGTRVQDRIRLHQYRMNHSGVLSYPCPGVVFMHYAILQDQYQCHNPRRELCTPLRVVTLA